MLPQDGLVTGAIYTDGSLLDARSHYEGRFARLRWRFVALNCIWCDCCSSTWNNPLVESNVFPGFACIWIEVFEAMAPPPPALTPGRDLWPPLLCFTLAPPLLELLLYLYESNNPGISPTESSSSASLLPSLLPNKLLSADPGVLL